MKYIKRVTLENFQSHKYSVIDFNEQLNVIVGPSDSGKSAIIRGIKWALYNEPSGDYFIKEGATECSVTLEFNDNVKLKRYRSKYKNSYILTNNNGDEIKFEGFGTNIPSEIIDLIGIKKIYLDSDESNSINLGEQLDGAFLLSEKTGTRASAIGRLVGVNIVDDALREVLKDTRNLNISKKNINEDIEKLEIEIKGYKYLEELNIKANKIEIVKSNIIKLSNRLDKTKASLTKLNVIDEEVKKLSYIIKRLDKVNKVNEVINTIDNKILTYKYLDKYNDNLINTTKKIVESNYIVNQLKDVNHINNILLELEGLCNRKKKLDNIMYMYIKNKKEKLNLQDISSKLRNLSTIDINILDINNKHKKLIELLKVKTRFDNVNSRTKTGKQYLSKLNGIEESKDKADLISNKLKLLNKYYNVYNNIVTNVKEMKNELINLKEINVTINDELSLYQELLKKIEICPFCLSNINDEKINHIINHYLGG